MGVQILTFADVEGGSRVVAERLVGVVGEILLERRAMALLSLSSADFLFTWLALMRLGHSVLLLAPQCQPSAIVHLCKTCNSSLLFYSVMYADQASASKQVMEQDNDWTGALKTLPLPFFDHQNIFNVINQFPRNHFIHAPLKEFSMAYYHHNSGTSAGLPKVIPQSHRVTLRLLPHLPRGSVPNNPIESPIPSRLPWQHNRIQLIGSDSIAIVDCNLPIATLTGVEDRGGGAASLCQDLALFMIA